MMDILCCPSCKSTLQITVEHEEGDDVIKGYLQCAQCNKKYPIVEGIPNFIDEIE